MPAKRSKSLFDLDKHTLEFSPGQLVMAICTILLMGLVSFLLGVVVGRYDHSYTDARIFDLGEDRQSGERTYGAGREPEGEGVQLSPRPVRLPEDSRDDGRVRMTELPAPTTSRGARSEPETSPPGPRGREREPAPPEFQQSRDAPAAPGEASEPPDESSPDGESESADEDSSEDASPEIEPLSLDDDEAPAETPGDFTIQVVAYTVADRTKASAYAREIQSRTNINTQVAQSEDGEHLRILVGSYEDRDSAERALAELKRNEEGFEDSFVRSRVSSG